MTTTSGYFNLADRNEYAWLGQLGAVEYHVARSTSPDFLGGCVLFTTQESLLVDTETPAPGEAFYYLIRASSPNLGSWGRGPGAAERFFSCM